MSIKEKLRNPFVQQYLIEIILPLIGYFFFDWSISVIVAFYLCDQFVAEILYLRRIHWINKYSGNAFRKWILPLSISLFLIFFTTEIFLISHFWQSLFESKINEVHHELLLFAKEEIWLLLPLMIWLYHIKDQFTFYAPRRYLNYAVVKSFKFQYINFGFTILLVTAGLILWKEFELPHIFVLTIIILTKILFDLTIGRWTDRRSKKV